MVVVCDSEESKNKTEVKSMQSTIQPYGRNYPQMLTRGKSQSRSKIAQIILMSLLILAGIMAMLTETANDASQNDTEVHIGQSIG